MKDILRKLPFFFLFGAIFYPMIEILYRGYSHFSMGILGGLCFCAIYLIHICLGKGKLLLKAALSALVITELEFLSGVLINILLDLSVWDYSDMPFNLLGQVCPLFSFFWFLLSLIPLTFFLKKESKQRKTALLFNK